MYELFQQVYNIRNFGRLPWKQLLSEKWHHLYKFVHCCWLWQDSPFCLSLPCPTDGKFLTLQQCWFLQKGFLKVFGWNAQLLSLDQHSARSFSTCWVQIVSVYMHIKSRDVLLFLLRGQYLSAVGQHILQLSQRFSYGQDLSFITCRQVKGPQWNPYVLLHNPGQ